MAADVFSITPTCGWPVVRAKTNRSFEAATKDSDNLESESILNSCCGVDTARPAADRVTPTSINAVGVR